MSPDPHRVLHLDDSPLDAELIQERIQQDSKASWTFELVTTREAYQAAIARDGWDLVLTDYNIPGYDGMSAVRHAAERTPDVPIIVVSGTLSEEDAVASLKAGATDYVFKQRLQRIGPAAERAIAEARERRQRREAEQVLRELSKRFALLAEQSRDVFWMCSLEPELRVTFVSPSVERVWGSSPEALYRDASLWLAPVHSEDRDRVSRALHDWIAGVAPQYDEEFRIVHAGGEVVWVHDTGTPLTREADGRLRQISGVARDITARKAADRELLEQEQRFRAMFEQAAVGIAFVDLEGRRLRINRRYAEILGYEPEELGPEVQIVHPDDDDAARERRERLLRGEASVTRGTKRYVRKDGRIIWCDITNSLVRDAEDRPSLILTVIQDVTDRVRAEERLRDSENLFRSTVNAMVEGVTVQDAAHRVVALNPGMSRITGMEPARLLGANVAGAEWTTLREDGSPLPPEERPSVVALRTGHPQHGVVVGFARPDGVLAWISVNAQPLRSSPDAAPHAVVSTYHDITESRRAEEALRESERRHRVTLERRVAERTQELMRANRELEAFSYSVSHDLRAPLAAVRGFAQALDESVRPRLSEEEAHYLDRIIAGGERMDALIEDMLSLSRLARADLVAQDVDMSALAREVLAELREREPKRKARLTVHDGMRAYADPRLIRIALTNLAANAWKFSSGRPEVVIEIGSLQAEGLVSPFFVRDEGAGFDPSRAGRLFGTFQRLHSQAEFPGTGIGLATVRRVIERHGGNVWAEGAEGRGATFYFTLPRSADPAAGPDGPPA